MRLQKYLAMCGLGSRRQCEIYIQQARVMVNGQIADQLGSVVDELTDTVAFDGVAIAPEKEKLYLVLNKPAGVVCTVKDTHGRKTVLDCLSGQVKERIYPVGRLDANTEGLIFLTNDGEFANHITHPRYDCEKEYRVVVRGSLSSETLYKIQQGVLLEDGMTAPCHASIISRNSESTTLSIILHEGRNRQIRRMMEAVEYRVQHLRRVRVGKVTLEGLALGEWRELTSQEVCSFLQD